jgi:hypothetical protein
LVPFDTLGWIDSLRCGDARLAALLALCNGLLKMRGMRC